MEIKRVPSRDVSNSPPGDVRDHSVYIAAFLTINGSQTYTTEMAA